MDYAMPVRNMAYDTLQYTKQEAVDMCQAIQEMMDEAAEKATRESAEKTTLDVARNLMRNMGIASEKAMELMGVPESQRKALSALL